MTRFVVTTAIAARPWRVFDVSLEIETHTASMAGSGERVIDGVRAGRMTLGDTVTWQARHFGRQWRMTSVISTYDPPYSFVDEQVTGPFRYWRHTHRFGPAGDGVTEMWDVVDFAAPLRPLGTIAELAVLKRYLHGLIQLRNDHVRAVAEAEG